MVKRRKKFLMSQEEFDKKYFYGDTEAAKLYIKESLKEYNEDFDRKSLFEGLFTAIKWIGITKFAKKIGLTRTEIQDALVKEDANPGFDTLQKIFNGLNLKLTFEIEDNEEIKYKTTNHQVQQAYL